MSRLEHERRVPRIHVDDLRRDLRHADQELYACHASKGRRAARTRRVRKGTSRTVLVIGLSGGLATAVWAALPTHHSHPDSTLHTQAHVVQTAALPDGDGRSEAAASLTAEPARLSTEAAPSNPDRLRRHVSTPATGVSLRAGSTHGKARASTAPPRRRPRPLSPGEFGREPALE